mgnify:CR=1 FL=1
MKYIFVTGGVVSGLGKGICAASLGRLLKQCGLRVRNQKFDPYFNVDPGTMSPYQHGEVFVTDDGAETDLDLGHYERFVDEALDGNASVSSGKVFWAVLNRERQGGYLGGTVQIIPHITDEIKRRVYAMDDGQTDVVITEIGGTVGDIESQPFLEAIRQVAAEKGRENVLYIHVPLIVSIPGSGELKSKPTQHSVKELLSVGIQPDVLVCRTDSPITEDVRRKIALFCNVEEDCVISNVTASTLYEVPLLLEKEGLCRVVCRKLGLELVSTPVGFKWIYGEMEKGGVMIGGEESGGIGIPTHVMERDGLLMALLLAEEVERAGIRDQIRLRKMICGAETRSEKMRLAIESKLGLEGSYDIAGMTEMYGPGTAMDCDAHEGLHYWADLFIIEVLDPDTLQPVPEGEVGEMVVTSLRKEAVPLLRYRTHDLTRLLPGRCSCGLNMPRHDRILGRSDDMVIYRGVNIYPGQIMEVIGQFPELGGEYQMELTRDERSLDHLALIVERAQDQPSGNDAALAQALERRLHKAILARMEVRVADYAGLPRTFSKSKRVIDKR